MKDVDCEIADDSEEQNEIHNIMYCHTFRYRWKCWYEPTYEGMKTPKMYK